MCIPREKKLDAFWRMIQCTCEFPRLAVYMKLTGVKNVLVVSFPLQGFGLGFCLVVLPFEGVCCFFPSLSNEKCKGKKFTSSSPPRAGLLSSIHILTLCLSPFSSSITAQINLLYHSLLIAWCTVWELF